VFSDETILNKIEKYGIELVLVDMTSNNETLTNDLDRANRKTIPVNLIYPADYPASPAILLEELITPADAHEALDKALGLDKSE